MCVCVLIQSEAGWTLWCWQLCCLMMDSVSLRQLMKFCSDTCNRSPTHMCTHTTDTHTHTHTNTRRYIQTKILTSRHVSDMTGILKLYQACGGMCFLPSPYLSREGQVSSPSNLLDARLVSDEPLNDVCLAKLSWFSCGRSALIT